MESTATITPAPITIIATKTTVTKTAGTSTRTITKRTTTTSKITKTVTATYVFSLPLLLSSISLTFSPVSRLLPGSLARNAPPEHSEIYSPNTISLRERSNIYSIHVRVLGRLSPLLTYNLEIASFFFLSAESFFAHLSNIVLSAASSIWFM